MEQKENKGALWIKKTKAGNDYYSVKVETEDGKSFWLNLFYNKNKKTDKHPSFVTIQQSKNENQQPKEDELPF